MKPQKPIIILWLFLMEKVDMFGHHYCITKCKLHFDKAMYDNT